MYFDRTSQTAKRESSLKEKKRAGIPGRRRTGLWVALTISVAALVGLYILWPCLNNSEPRLEYLVISKDGERINLLNGEKARFNPRNKLRILDIQSNVCFNRGVRLVAEGLDINSLLYEDVSLSDLLKNKESYTSFNFRVWVKRYNQDIGYVDFVIEMLAEDWLDLADRSTEVSTKIDVLKKAMENLPNERRIKDRLVNEYISIKEWGEAAGILEGMIREKPDRAILERLLELYKNMSDKDGVISVMRRLVELSPDDTALRLNLAAALENAGKSRDAIVEYEGLIDRMKPEELLPVYNNLGYLYAEAGESEEAISFYLKALELNRDDANIYYNLSLLYEKTGRKDKANQYLAKAVELKPDSIDDNMRLARNLMEAGKLKEAKDALQEFLKDNPKSLDAWLLMSGIAEKNGDKTLLKTVYERILEIDPRNSNVIYNLGVMEYETGNMDKALTYLINYIQSAPDDGSARSILFDIYRAQKKDDLAFTEASAIIKLKPNEKDCYQFIYDYLDRDKRYSEMAGIMEAGVKANPKDTGIRKYLIAAYLGMGKESEALTQMKAVLDLAPKDSAVLMQMAKLYEKQDRPGEAMTAYKKLLDISPDNEEAEEAYMMLRLKTLPK